MRAAAAMALAMSVTSGFEYAPRRTPANGHVGRGGKANPAKKAERKRQRNARRKQR